MSDKSKSSAGHSGSCRPASDGSAADVEKEKTFVRNRSNCYLRHMGLPGPCPGTGGGEAWFCEHPKCSADDYY